MTRRSHGLLLAALLLAAFNLRTAIAGVPPLLDDIRADTGLSAAGAGALTTVPVLCMAMFAPVAVVMSRRLGAAATIALSCAVLTVGLLVRPIGGTAGVLLVGTFVAGAGIGVLQAVLPPVVSETWAGRAGLITGLYTMSFAVGATLASALAVPLAGGGADWPRSLALWAIPALLALGVWVPIANRVRRRAAVRATGPARALPWRSRTAWLLALLMSGQSLVFYCLLSWLAPTYEGEGWTASQAGLLLAVFNAVGPVASLTLPAVSDRSGDRRPWLLLALACTALGLLGVVVAPLSASFVWVVLLGLGTGGSFSLGLTLIVDLADSPAAAGGLTSLAFLVSYTVAAFGPVLLGALRDTTGAFTAGWWLVLLVVVLQVPLAVRLRRPALGI